MARDSEVLAPERRAISSQRHQSTSKKRRILRRSKVLAASQKDTCGGSEGGKVIVTRFMTPFLCGRKSVQEPFRNPPGTAEDGRKYLSYFATISSSVHISPIRPG